jgi:hypothetical protein
MYIQVYPMRNVTPTITAAVTLPSEYRIGTRLTAYKSRVFFDSFQTGISIGGKPENYSGNPLSETIMHFAPVIGGVRQPAKIVTAIITSDIYKRVDFAVENGSYVLAPRYNNGATTEMVYSKERTRPAFWADNENNVYRIFYFWKGDGTTAPHWQVRDIDPEKLNAHDDTCVSAAVPFCTALSQGAIYPVSANEAVIFDVSEGGVRVSFVDHAGGVHSSSHRFMNPTRVMNADSDDLYALHYAGAAKLGSTIFAYFRSHTGAVKSIKYTLAVNGKDGSWSDIFTSVPEDLCSFDIASVFTVGNRIFMCGRFYREEDFASNNAYTLLVWSDDGITFTLNRRVLCSLLNYRFLASFFVDEIAFSSANRIHKETAPYQMIGEDTESIVVDLLNLSGNLTGELLANCRAGSEEYFESFVDTGTYGQLELSQDTSAGKEHIKYHDVVISSVTKGIRDGVRTYTIGMLTDGLWHTGNMSNPFYMEFQGKQAVFDSCADLSNLVSESVGENPKWALSVDLWNGDGSAFINQEHVKNTTTDHWSPDLTKYYSEFPTFGDALRYTVNIYGWSRAGNWNVNDGSPTNTLNDTFMALIEFTTPTSETRVIKTATTADGGILTSAYNHPPQSYVEVHPGSVPVSYTIPNWGKGYRITRLGVRVTSGSLGSTTYNIERIEMPEIVCEPVSLSTDPTFEADTPAIGTDGRGFSSAIKWEIYNDPSSSYTVGYPPNWSTFTNLVKSTSKITPIKFAYGYGYPTALAGNSFWSAKFSGKISIKREDNYTFIFGGLDDGAILTIDNVVVLQDWTVHAPITRTSSPIHLSEGEHSFLLEYFQGPAGEASLDLRWSSSYFTAETIPMSSESADTPKTGSITNKKKGVPQVLFSSRPYSAFNFEQTARVKFIGQYAKLGLIGLATDKKNFITAYIQNNKVCLSKVRNGVETTLTSLPNAGITPDTQYDIRFWHRDGKFGFEWKLASGYMWPSRESYVTYRWKSADGAMAVNDDIFHVGVYSFIDPPRFRIIGHRSKQNVLGVLPLDIDPSSGMSDFLTAFPASGKIDLDGTIYKYTGKSIYFPDGKARGPFQLRNIRAWDSPYNVEYDGSFTYVGGNAIEFLMFDWHKGGVLADYAANAIINSDAGYAWQNTQVQWAPWIRTSGQQELLRNRARFYSSGIPDYYPSGYERIYVTNGLTGVSPDKESTDEYQHTCGTFAYFDSGDKTTLYGFSAASGEQDQTIRYLLDVFCKLSGTKSKFPGDFQIPSVLIYKGMQEYLHD